MSVTFVSTATPIHPDTSVLGSPPRRGWFFAAVLVGLPLLNLAVAVLLTAAAGDSIWAEETLALAIPFALAANLPILLRLARRAGWDWGAAIAGTVAAMALTYAWGFAVFIVALIAACSGGGCYS